MFPGGETLCERVECFSREHMYTTLTGLGLVPRSLDAQSSTLTIKPPRRPQYFLTYTFVNTAPSEFELDFLGTRTGLNLQGYDTTI